VAEEYVAVYAPLAPMLALSAVCLMAVKPVLLIPTTATVSINAPVAASDVQSHVFVMADGDEGTSWFATKSTDTLPDSVCTRSATLVYVMPFADAVIVVSVATVPVPLTITNNRSPAVGVNELDG